MIGDFNDWNKSSNPLQPKGQSGIWEGLFPGIGKGTLYKYHIDSRFNGYQVDKADPFSVFNEIPPRPPLSFGILGMNGATNNG